MQQALASLFVALLCLANSAAAQNSGFLPGDAFFHAMLTETSVDKLVADEEAVLDYARPKWEEGTFSGYAGYWKLRLPADCEAMLRNLQLVYKHIRLSVPRELREYRTAPGTSKLRPALEVIETNGLHVFVYNAAHDCHRYPLGLRYNESWVADIASFGPDPRWVRLEFFIVDRDAFSADWRDASRVPKLDVKCPEIPDEAHRKALRIGDIRIDAPLEVRGSIQLVVVPTERLESYIRRKNGAYFYSITDDGVKHHRIQKGEWTVSDWSP